MVNNYGISFIADNTTIMAEADYFNVADGMIQLFSNESDKPFAAYNVSDVYHIVKQKKYTDQEVLDEINKLRNDECQM